MERYAVLKQDNSTHPYAVFKYIAGPGANFWQQISNWYFHVGCAIRFSKNRNIALERVEM